jgi:hypothetical protein
MARAGLTPRPAWVKSRAFLVSTRARDPFRAP